MSLGDHAYTVLKDRRKKRRVLIQFIILLLVLLGIFYAFFFLKCFAERADDLFHRGRAVGRDRGSILLRTAYKRQRGEGNDKYSRQNFVHLFHFDDLLFLFV